MGICCMAQGTQIGALYQAPMRGGMRREMGGRFKMEGIYVYLWLTPGVGDEQGGLACYNSWGRRVRHD